MERIALYLNTVRVDAIADHNRIEERATRKPAAVVADRDRIQEHATWDLASARTDYFYLAVVAVILSALLVCCFLRSQHQS